MIDAPFWDMVAWGRIELQTRGFSIRANGHFTVYAAVDKLHKNQQLKAIAV